MVEVGHIIGLLSLAVGAICLAVVCLSKGLSRKRKLICLLVGVIVFVIGLVIIFMISPVHLEITQPLSNTAVNCESITQDGECAITVRVRIEGKIKESEFIRVLAKEHGGKEWWVTGEAVPASGAIDEFSIGSVTIGSPEGKNKKYKLMAIVTEENLKPGYTDTQIPNHSVASKHVSVTRIVEETKSLRQNVNM
jgi:hypothetical protein